MKLSDLDLNSKKIAVRALKESFDFELKLRKMGITETSAMLKKIRNLINETKSTSEYHESHKNSSFMKMIFMEQALKDHYSDLLKRQQSTRIVLENEAVEEAQVTLAAQDLCNSIQKMLKEVGKMQIEELPALVDGIESEIGVNESKSYEQIVSQQLDTLYSTLKETFQQLKSARDALTGGNAAAFQPDNTQDAENVSGMPDEESSEPEMPEMPEMPTEPEEGPVTNVGRSKR